MRTQTRLLLCVTATAVVMLAPGAGAQPAGTVRDLEAAKVAWKQRHERVHALRATLTKEVTTHRGTYVLARQAAGGKYPAPPEKEVTVAYDCSLAVKGDQLFRFAYTGQRWNPFTRMMEPVDYFAISNPQNRVNFRQGTGPDRPPSASQTNSSKTSDETVIALVPLMLTVRSGEPHHRQLSDYTPTGKTVAVDGRSCVEALKGSRTEGRTEYVYLDPERDWVVSRIDGYTDGELTKRITAEYTPHPVVGWLPTSWSWVNRLQADIALSSGRVTAKEYEVNGDIPDEEFRPKYPPGTVVVDDKHGPLGQTISLVNQDGSPGVAIPLSQQPSLEQLSEMNRSVRRQRMWLFALGGAALLLGVVAVWSYRRRRTARGAGGGDPIGVGIAGR